MHHVKLDLTRQSEQRKEAADKNDRRQWIDGALYTYIGLEGLCITPDIQMPEGTILEEVKPDSLFYRVTAYVGVVGGEHMYFVPTGRNACGNRLDKGGGDVSLIFGIGRRDHADLHMAIVHQTCDA
jgi:hypothetical protein